METNRFNNFSKISLSHLFYDDISNRNCLEMFGGIGLFQTDFFAERCKNFEIWEIDKNKCDFLVQQFQNSTVKCCNSLEFIHELTKFSIIAIDAPLCVFGDNAAEHFPIFQNLDNFLGNTTFLINVVTNPYNYSSESNSEWRKIRNQFYGVDEIDIEFAKKFYKNYFQDRGYVVSVRTHVKECRDNQPYLHHMRIDISK